jgi:RNA polymerase sigma-70 factor (ECF subfamily)
MQTHLESLGDSKACEGAVETLTIEALVNGYYAYVRRVALSLLDDAEEAEDAAQETFIAAARALEHFRGEASYKTWLTTIALNQCRSRLRKHKARRTLQAVLEMLHFIQPTPGSPETGTELRESKRRLWAFVAQLDERQRECVILRYVHELSTPEIASVLGIREGTVHSRLHTARQRLQAQLNSSGIAEVENEN